MENRSFKREKKPLYVWVHESEIWGIIIFSEVWYRIQTVFLLSTNPEAKGIYYFFNGLNWLSYWAF